MPLTKSLVPLLLALALAFGAAACSPAADDAPDAGRPGDGRQPDAGAGTDAGHALDSLPGGDVHGRDSGPGGDGFLPCPTGTACVTAFPFADDRDTSLEPPGIFDSYACKPTANEGGPEVVYRVDLPQAGFLSAAVYEQDGVDVDVHILDHLDPDTCLDRGDLQARADVGPGEHYVIVDTFVQGGTALAGPFHLDIGFTVPSRGPCAVQAGEMPRVGDGGQHLVMPATGPVVLEAHLVTQEEPPPYPSTSTEELAAHYALSQSRTGFVMHREQVWAPLEGGTFYGAGIGSPTMFPVLHEAWYVNMYWTREARPARGTRMLFRQPGGRRAVVVAAGYETGPGNLTRIGGTPEETHFYLGTGHLGELTLGIAVDQTLPFGPRECTDE